MKTYLHVNRQKIHQNIKHNTNVPVCAARNYKDVKYSKIIDIVDDSGKVIASLVQADEELGIKPLSCGARAYVITDSKNVRIRKCSAS